MGVVDEGNTIQTKSATMAERGLPVTYQSMGGSRLDSNRSGQNEKGRLVTTKYDRDFDHYSDDQSSEYTTSSQETINSDDGAVEIRIGPGEREFRQDTPSYRKPGHPVEEVRSRRDFNRPFIARGADSHGRHPRKHLIPSDDEILDVTERRRDKEMQRRSRERPHDRERQGLPQMSDSTATRTLVTRRETPRSGERQNYSNDNEDDILARRSQPARRTGRSPRRSYSAFNETQAGALIIPRSPPSLVIETESSRRERSAAGQYRSSRADGPLERSKTPAPSRRSGSRRLLREVPAYRASYYVRPSSYQSRVSFESSPTDEDIISRTLRRFTTFDENARPDLTMSPDGMDSPTFAINPESRNLSLEKAQRKLDELTAKHAKAIEDGDFFTKSDLQFYAIPEIRAQVEELKIQEARRHKDSNAEADAERSPAGMKNTSEEGPPSNPRLQQSIISSEVLNVSSDAVGSQNRLPKRESSKNSPAADRATPNGTVENNTSEGKDQITEDDAVPSGKLDGGPSSGGGDVERIIRRPTNATVEDGDDDTNESCKD